MFQQLLNQRVLFRFIGDMNPWIGTLTNIYTASDRPEWLEIQLDNEDPVYVNISGLASICKDGFVDFPDDEIISMDDIGDHFG